MSLPLNDDQVIWETYIFWFLDELKDFEENKVVL